MTCYHCPTQACASLVSILPGVAAASLLSLFLPPLSSFSLALSLALYLSIAFSLALCIEGHGCDVHSPSPCPLLPPSPPLFNTRLPRARAHTRALQHGGVRVRRARAGGPRGGQARVRGVRRLRHLARQHQARLTPKTRIDSDRLGSARIGSDRLGSTQASVHRRHRPV